MAESDLRILHIAESIRGGVGTYLNHVAPLQLAELGPRSVKILAPDCDVDHLSALAGHPAVQTFRRRGRSLTSLLSLIASLTPLIRAFRPTVVHAHSSFAGAIARLLLAVWPGRPKIVYCSHGWAFDADSASWKIWLYQRAEHILSGLCDQIVTISEYERQRALDIGIASDRLTVVPNGVPDHQPAGAILAWEDPRLKILFIGRLDRQKGADILLRAVRNLGDQASVRIVGNSVADHARFRKRDWTHVEFMGWRNEAEIAGLLRGADVVVMPSRWEGFGLVAVEAMRAAKPVIASSVGGLPEIIVDHETGYLTPPGDAEALANILATLDRRRLQEMGMAGRRRFLALFTLRRVHAQLMRVYRGLMEPASQLAE